MRRGVRRWWWLGLAWMAAGCGDPGGREAAAVERPDDRAWRTRDWPMAGGGPELRNRAADPVPAAPRIEWSFAAGAAVTAVSVAGGVVVAGDEDGGVRAIDLATRSARWSVRLDAAVGAAPAIAGGRVFVGTAGGEFHALDLRDGGSLWRITSRSKFPTGAVVVGDPSGAGDWVLVNGYDGRTRCLRAADGSEAWGYQTDDYINGSPAVVDGRFVVFGGCDSQVHVLSLADGCPAGQVATSAQIVDSVACHDATAYACNHAGEVVAVEIGREEPAWVSALERGGFLSAPGVDDERVYVGSRDGRVHALDRRDGAVLWQVKAGAGVVGAPLVFDDAVVVATDDGRLHALGTDDGRAVWTLDLGEEPTAAPVFADGRIIAGGAEGTLVIIR